MWMSQIRHESTLRGKLCLLFAGLALADRAGGNLRIAVGGHLGLVHQTNTHVRGGVEERTCRTKHRQAILNNDVENST